MKKSVILALVCFVCGVVISVGVSSLAGTNNSSDKNSDNKPLAAAPEATVTTASNNDVAPEPAKSAPVSPAESATPAAQADTPAAPAPQADTTPTPAPQADTTPTPENTTVPENVDVVTASAPIVNTTPAPVAITLCVTHGANCGGFVDHNGDSICDYYGNSCGTHGFNCGGFVDHNGDGICDYYNTVNTTPAPVAPVVNTTPAPVAPVVNTAPAPVVASCGTHGFNCGGFVDSNGDGICDYYGSGSGNGYGYGYHHSESGGHHGGGHW